MRAVEICEKLGIVLNDDPMPDWSTPYYKLERAISGYGVDQILYYKTGEMDWIGSPMWRVRLTDAESSVVGEPHWYRPDALASAAEKYLKARGVI